MRVPPRPIRIVADENIPRQVVEHLQALGYRVDWVLQESPGIPDDQVWETAAARQALLLTIDDGFLGQLTDQQIQLGPKVLVFKTSGIQENDLQAPEFFSEIAARCLTVCDVDSWEYVDLTLRGKNLSLQARLQRARQGRRRARPEIPGVPAEGFGEVTPRQP